jgi:hypothetical protein
MKQVKNIGIAAMALFLAGCDEIKFNGSMNVLEQITFSQSQGKTVTVAPGRFATKVTLSGNNTKKKIKFEIKNADPATEVKLEFDKNINIGQTFTITAAQLKQNFDLAGTMDTRVEKSPENSRYEHCTYQYPQTVCRGGSTKSSDEAVAAKVSEFAAASAVETPEASNPVLVETDRHAQHPGNFAAPHQPVCHTVWVSRPGQRYVRYFIETTSRDIDASFVQAGRNLGSFKGHSKQNRTVYTYQSDCR